jgi:heat shock protein HtpX
MPKAYGLYTHIAANRLKSLILLFSFVVLLQALIFSLNLVVQSLDSPTLDIAFARALETMSAASPIGFGIAAIWFAVAWVIHGRLIARATGARSVTRQEAPQLYASLENLCISRGIAMPKLQIIESPALNAYASGISPGSYQIAVTRGLLQTLSPRELESVLAHELTHIRNKDTQMMVIAAIFAGIFAFVGDITFRNWDFPYGWSPKRPASSRPGRKGDGTVILVAIIIALIVIAISWGVSVLIRLAISRSREFMADAGAVELTKDADSMISALRKISGHAAIVDMPSRMHAFFIESPAVRPVSSLFATHPDVEERIAALVAYAGGRDDGVHVQVDRKEAGTG